MSRQNDPLYSPLAYYKALFNNDGKSIVAKETHMDHLVVFDRPKTMDHHPEYLYRYFNSNIPTHHIYTDGDQISFHAKFGLSVINMYRKAYIYFSYRDGVSTLSTKTLFDVSHFHSLHTRSQIDDIVLSLIYQYSHLKYEFTEAKICNNAAERICVLKLSFKDKDKQEMDIYIDLFNHAVAIKVGNEMFEQFVREKNKLLCKQT